MTVKWYEIFLGDKKTGITELEKSDAPMGIVFGTIIFISIISGYDFKKKTIAWLIA